jgi:hypothetical protein
MSFVLNPIDPMSFLSRTVETNAITALNVREQAEVPRAELLAPPQTAERHERRVWAELERDTHRCDVS